MQPKVMLLPTVVMPCLAQGCGIEETGACAWLAVGAMTLQLCCHQGCFVSAVVATTQQTPGGHVCVPQSGLLPGLGFLDLVPVCGVEWAGLGYLLSSASGAQWGGSHWGRPLSALSGGKQAPTYSSQVESRLSRLSHIGSPSSQGGCLLCTGAQDWDTQSVIQPAHFPGQPSSPDSFSHPTWLHGNLSCSLGCIGVLLPVSSFPWDLFYTWIYFWCVCGGRWPPHPFTWPSWWLVWY